MSARVIHGDCQEVLKTMDSDSICAIVTDPPYEIGMMGRAWDSTGIANSVEMWREAYRVLKPGGHLLAFSATRTQHRMVCAIEDAGFEIRDQIGWMYGTGFPKSHNVSVAIDKAAGAEREVLGNYDRRGLHDGASRSSQGDTGASQCAGRASLVSVTAPATPAAQQWAGWGTALKPAWEPIVVGSKPLTVAQHFAINVRYLSSMIAELAICNGVSASVVGRSFSDIQAKLAEVGDSTVLDSARMRSLESIGIASSAALSSTSNDQRSFASIKTKDDTALSHVRPQISAELQLDPTTRHGLAGDLLSQLTAMFTSVITDGIGENTVSLWRHISVALLSDANMFTIETASRLTTALKTLNSLMLPNITGGTGGLSPNWEPICVARKPLSEGTVAANVLEHGVGALNIDACRVPSETRPLVVSDRRSGNNTYADGLCGSKADGETTPGRWPANVIHSGDDEVLEAFAQFGERKSSCHSNTSETDNPQSVAFGKRSKSRATPGENTYSDKGTAARFFYSAKASKADRAGSKHPTVKNLALMKYLCKLVTPPGGTVLDMFAGSGTTLQAALEEGFHAIGIERELEYYNDCKRRLGIVDPAPEDDIDAFLAELVS